MKSTRAYLPTLDGWRALSVIGVIVFHGRFEFFSHNNLADHIFLHIAQRGYLGLDCFFAMSGFLICRLLLAEQEHTGAIDLTSFYLRRIFRILPAYYCCLVVLALLEQFRAIHLNQPDFIASLLFYRNYTPLGMDEQHGYYTAHFWTLAVEEHFYMVAPVILAFYRRYAVHVAAAWLVLSIAWRIINPQVMGDTHMDGLLWGTLGAIYWPSIVDRFKRYRHLWLIPASLLVACLVLLSHRDIVYPVGSFLVSVLILTTVLDPQSLPGRLLETRLLRWIGSLSYSVYLWQQLFVPHMAGAWGGFRVLQIPPLNLVSILVMSLVSRYAVELPMIRLGRWWIDRNRAATVQHHELVAWTR